MVQGREENGKLIITLTGKIDSSNANLVGAGIQALRHQYPCESIILDCEKLDYSSSAGLRVILRLTQEVEDTVLINVNSELYNILDLTGFTEMMEVHRAYRVLSVEGCEVIGQGANGKIYRIDADTILKVYYDEDALPEIDRSRELSRLAFISGIPTAIPYDVVRIEGGGYGSVFELLNATSFAKLIIDGEKTPDEAAEMSIDLLKLIHSKHVHSDILPDMKAVALDWAGFLKDYLPAEQFDKLYSLIDAVPADEHLVHGDYHLKNVMLQNGESLLIDMDTLCHGHPIFELASMYNAYEGYSLVNHDQTLAFLGIPYDVCCAFWRKCLELYLGTRDQEKLDDVEAKAKIVGLTRVMRREIRRNGLNREDGRALIEACRNNLAVLLPKTDTLLF